MMKHRRVGQMQWGVAGQLGVALRLLERRSRVGIAAHDLGTAVAQRTLVISLEGTTRGQLKASAQNELRNNTPNS